MDLLFRKQRGRTAENSPDSKKKNRLNESDVEVSGEKYSDRSEHCVVDKNIFLFNTAEGHSLCEGGGIDLSLIQSGTLFHADFADLLLLKTNEAIVVDILDQHFCGAIVEKKKSKSGRDYIVIEFGNPSSHMYVHYGKRITRGKINSERGCYLFEHNGNLGYLVSVDEGKQVSSF